MAKTVLLVDDDSNILETAQDILEAAGFAVRTAAAGEEALQSLRDDPSRLMLIDFNLLDMTGAELAVKAKAICPAVVILMMTGEAHVHLGPAQEAIQATLTKPVNPAELIDLLHKFC